MDLFNIQALIAEGKIIDLTNADLSNTYIQLGVYQAGSRKRAASNANSYLPYVISLDSLISSKANKDLEIVTYNVDHQLTLADAGKLIKMDVGAPNVVIVPDLSVTNFPIGTQILIAQHGTGQTSFVAGGAATIVSEGGALNMKDQYAMATLIQTNANEWYLAGNIIP